MRFLTIPTLLAIPLILTGCGAGGALNKQDELPVRCLEKPDPGPCRAALIKFFYDYREDRCQPFQYGGCKGRVPFDTLQQCVQECVAGS